MKNTPARYLNVCDKALQVQKDLKLDDAQTLMYNHVCQKDFYLFGPDGQTFYDPNIKGFGWGEGSRNWVKKKMKILVDKGLVTHEIKRAPRDKRYRHHYWYDSECNLNSLINACCFVSAWKLFFFFCSNSFFLFFF